MIKKNTRSQGTTFDFYFYFETSKFSDVQSQQRDKSMTKRPLIIIIESQSIPRNGEPPLPLKFVDSRIDGVFGHNSRYPHRLPCNNVFSSYTSSIK